jgi:hypothetical protein
MSLPCLTLKQPWASWIFTEGKDIENRGRTWKHRGVFAIHAGLSFDKGARPKIMRFMLDEKELRADLPRGAIVGVVNLVDVVTSGGEWFRGPYGYVLARPRMLATPIPCDGKRGVWYVPYAIERRVRRELGMVV